MTGSPPTFSDLLTDLASTQIQGRRIAIRQLLFWYPTQALPPLLQMLQDPSTSVRLETIQALRLLHDQRAIPALLPFLADRSARMRRTIIGTLFSLRDPHLLAHLTPLR
jgi:HEAT repeat protein